MNDVSLICDEIVIVSPNRVKLKKTGSATQTNLIKEVADVVIA